MGKIENPDWPPASRMSTCFRCFSRQLGKVRWTTLQRLAETGVVRSSWLWIVLVPPAAMALGRLQQEIAKRPPVLDDAFWAWLAHVDLPFSWRTLFCAALAFTLGNLLYGWRCPTIVRLHKNLTSFTDAGMDGDHLCAYGLEIAGPPESVSGGPLDEPPVDVRMIQGCQLAIADLAEDGRSLVCIDPAHGCVADALPVPSSAFWTIHDLCNDSRRASLLVAAVLYLGGLVAVAAILFMKATWVFF